MRWMTQLEFLCTWKFITFDNGKIQALLEKLRLNCEGQIYYHNL